jgi:ketosteroid isomerase-like protein
MNPGAHHQVELIGVLDGFCAAFAARDAEAVMRLFSSDPHVVVVTSEESVLRGRAELKRFLDHY